MSTEDLSETKSIVDKHKDWVQDQFKRDRPVLQIAEELGVSHTLVRMKLYMWGNTDGVSGLPDIEPFKWAILMLRFDYRTRLPDIAIMFGTTEQHLWHALKRWGIEDMLPNKRSGRERKPGSLDRHLELRKQKIMSWMHDSVPRQEIADRIGVPLRRIVDAVRRWSFNPDTPLCEAMDSMFEVVGRTGMSKAKEMLGNKYEPFYLRAVEEMSYRAIADELDIPVGTVKSRIYRARKQIEEETDVRRSENAIVYGDNAELQ